MTETRPDFSKATPRPWSVSNDPTERAQPYKKGDSYSETGAFVYGPDSNPVVMGGQQDEVGGYVGFKENDDAALCVYAVNNIEAREALIAELVERLETVRPLVEKWCHYQGDNAKFITETLAPIDSLIAKAKEEK